MMFWYLDENNVPVAHPLVKFAEFVEQNGDPRRQVARDEPVLGIEISTVFLAHDLAANSHTSRPLCFETMIFSDSHEELRGDRERYYTWEEAVAGHAKWYYRVLDAVIGGSDA